MAFSEQEMLADLAAADAAGDTKTAQHIAGLIKAQRAAKAAPPTKVDPSAGGGTLSLLNPFGENFDTRIPIPEALNRGLAGAGAAVNRLGNLFRSDAEVAEQKRLEQPLMDTTAGKVGEIAGDIALGVAGGGAGTAALRAAPKVFQGAQAVKTAMMTAPKTSQAVLGNMLGGAGLSGAAAAPEDRGMDALIGAVTGGAGEGLGRGIGRLVAPYRPKGGLTVRGEQAVPPMGTPGKTALTDADRAIIAKELGTDIEAALPLSGQLPGDTGKGVLRTEIAMRNLPVVGGGIKADDEAIKEAYTRYLFKQTGTDIGNKAFGRDAIRLAEDTVNRNADALASALSLKGGIDVTPTSTVGKNISILADSLRTSKVPSRSGGSWTAFDDLVADTHATKRLGGEELSALRTRANELIEDVRNTPGMPAREDRLRVLRTYKLNLDNAADNAIKGIKPKDPLAPKTFSELSKQQGMLSTLREARDTAGLGHYSPEAIAKQMETALGPTKAAAEKLPVQELTGALERAAGGSFASGPEQYKALMAGTLMGQGAFGMLGNLKAAATSPLAVMMLGTKGGRNYMQADPWRASLAKILEQGIAGGGAGQADLFGL